MRMHKNADGSVTPWSPADEAAMDAEVAALQETARVADINAQADALVDAQVNGADNQRRLMAGALKLASKPQRGQGNPTPGEVAQLNALVAVFDYCDAVRGAAA